MQWDRGGLGVVSLARIRKDLSSIHNTRKLWEALVSAHSAVAMSLSLVLATVLMSENTAGGPEPAQCAQGLCVLHRTHPAWVISWFTINGADVPGI